MTSRDEPLVSIVSPVYNEERHLRECIESVLSQTYGNWEYIVVNNRSSDRTLEIASEYSARDTRIRIYTNERHVRVIENHNIGLRYISAGSKYCKVLGGDDCLDPQCLEKMVRVAEQHPRVVIVGAYASRGSWIAWTGLHNSITAMSGREIVRAFMLGQPDVFGTPTSLLYRSDIVRSRDAFYNESNVHADTEVCCEFLENADFGFVHQVLTYSRVRPNSLTSVSESLNTYAPWGLLLLDKYGPRYLQKDELERRTRQQVASYYSYLGEQLFRRRSDEFWRLHREKLEEVGRPLRKGRLAFSAIMAFADIALNPKRSIEALVRHRRATKVTGDSPGSVGQSASGA